MKTYIYGLAALLGVIGMATAEDLLIRKQNKAQIPGKQWSATVFFNCKGERLTVAAGDIVKTNVGAKCGDDGGGIIHHVGVLKDMKATDASAVALTLRSGDGINTNLTVQGIGKASKVGDAIEFIGVAEPGGKLKVLAERTPAKELLQKLTPQKAPLGLEKEKDSIRERLKLEDGKKLPLTPGKQF